MKTENRYQVLLRIVGTHAHARAHTHTHTHVYACTRTHKPRPASAAKSWGPPLERRVLEAAP